MNSQQIKELLETVYAGSKATDWKRTSKLNCGPNTTVRFFTNAKTEQQAAVFCDPSGKLDIYDKINGLCNQGNMAQRLIAACATIRHCGDYCDLYWNEKTRTVHLTMGDCDLGGCLSSESEIRALLNIEGVDNVVIADEYEPYGDDDESKPYGDFVKLGTNLGVVPDCDE